MGGGGLRSDAGRAVGRPLLGAAPLYAGNCSLKGKERWPELEDRAEMALVATRRPVARQCTSEVVVGLGWSDTGVGPRDAGDLVTAGGRAQD